MGIAFGLNDDFEIVDALREAVNETLQDMEQDVMTRVNLPGGQEHKKTRNLVAAVQIHPDARAVEGHVPDVNLHAHAFISNHTFTGDRWTAADISNIFRDAQGYYEAGFQSRLATKLQALGYEVERTENNFEIVGVSRELIDKFSKRSQEINELVTNGYAERLAAKKGISLDDAKDMLGALSRKAKEQSFTLQELQEHWRDQLTTEESRELDQLRPRKETRSQTQEFNIDAKQAVDFALHHGFEKEAVLRERNVLRDAMLHGIGGNTVADIEKELASRDLIRAGTEEAAIVTTKELQKEERHILDFAVRGRGKVAPLSPHHEIKRDWLGDEQKQAVAELLQSPDRLQVLRGAAGVGKTTSMQEAVEAIEATGKHVAVMAPGTKAAYDVLRDQDGFDATTIAAFLYDEERQKQVEGGVIWIDEAGLVGNPTMLAVLDIAKKKNARVILGGDTYQHTPVERGHPMKQVIEQGGIQPKEITNIRRQSGDYKTAVGYLSRGEVAQGFQGLDDLGYIHEIQDDDRDQALAKAYADSIGQYKQKDLLVIAPTHAERRKITNAIRDELKAKGVIQGKESEITTLISKQLSLAQRQDAINYQHGDVVAFHGRGKGGIKPGTQLTVDRVVDGKVFAQGAGELPLSSAGAFNVFRPETAKYAKGDLIRLTRGRHGVGDQKKLTNGSVHSIKSINRGVITLDNNEKLRSDFRFFDHGVTVTSHVSQGTTVKRAFVAQSSLSFGASSPEQLYVSASRAKKRVDIFTDSRDGLLDAVQRYRPKSFASDVKPEEADKATLHRLSGGFNRIKQIAHQIAVKQLQRFHDWLPNKQTPELAR